MYNTSGTEEQVLKKKKKVFSLIHPSQLRLHLASQLLSFLPLCSFVLFHKLSAIPTVQSAHPFLTSEPDNFNSSECPSYKADGKRGPGSAYCSSKGCLLLQKVLCALRQDLSQSTTWLWISPQTFWNSSSIK